MVNLICSFDNKGYSFVVVVVVVVFVIFVVFVAAVVDIIVVLFIIVATHIVSGCGQNSLFDSPQVSVSFLVRPNYS